VKRTLLFSFHKENGHLGEYAGFEMPLWYKSPTVEHMSVRENVGIFDISHMGRLLITGSEAIPLLDRILTNNCATIEHMACQHGFFCNSHGGILDDVLVFRLSKEEFFIVVNAANKKKDLRWIEKNRAGFEIKVKDLTRDVPMIAVQGPKAAPTLQRIFGSEIAGIPYMRCSWIQADGLKILISRTGYTGEDGFELYIFGKPSEEETLDLWNSILEAGKDFGIEPCGLAARDTLRLEAGFCLYGNELDENTTPIEARLNFGVKIDERDFIGKDALLRQIREGVSKTRIGLRMIGRGIPRKGMDIMQKDEKVGVVTSGTLSPILKIGIAMGYVPPAYSPVGTKLHVSIRGRMVEAEVVKFPFYDKKKYGRKRKTGR
jgi:aminomethyltransferase